MRYRPYLLVAVVVLSGVAGFANKKEKKTLPDVVLKARTVTVMIRPGAREPMSDPNADLKAQKEVEKALMKWGRYELAPDVQTADLVISVQKGTGKAADATIGGGPVDNVPVIGERTDTGTDSSIRVGVRQGTPPPATQYPDPQTTRPSEGAQIGGADDQMGVYLGGVEYPLDASPVWTFTAKDALKGPDVKAVEEFRKAIEAAEKAAQQKQQRQGQKPNSGTPTASKPPAN